MPDGLEIVNIATSPPKLSEPDTITGHQEQWVDVAITVRNISARTTYFAISSLRTLQYDANNRTLKLGLSEPQPSQEEPPLRIVSPHVRLPNLTPILPNEELVLELKVPLVIKRLLPPRAGKVEHEKIDISDLESISVRLQYGTQPFRPKQTRPPGEVRAQLRTWGEMVERNLPSKIAPEQGGTFQDPGQGGTDANYQ